MKKGLTILGAGVCLLSTVLKADNSLPDAYRPCHVKNTYCQRQNESLGLFEKYYEWFGLINRAYKLPVNQINKKIELYTQAIAVVEPYLEDFKKCMMVEVPKDYDFYSAPDKDLQPESYLPCSHHRCVEKPVPLFVGWVDRAVNHLNRANGKAALEDAKVAVNLAPSEPDTWRVKSRAEGNRMNFDTALSDMETMMGLLRSKASMRVAYNDVGNLFFSAREYDHAVYAFKIAYEKPPRELRAGFLSKVQNNWGAAEKAMGHLDIAKTKFDKAIELDKNSALAFLNRAKTFTALGKTEEAKADLFTAAKLDPGEKEIFYTRAQLQYLLKNQEAAKADIQAAEALAPQDSYIQLWKGIIHSSTVADSIPNEKELAVLFRQLFVGGLSEDQLIAGVKTHAQNLIPDNQPLLDEVMAQAHFYLFLWSKEKALEQTESAQVEIWLKKAEDYRAKCAESEAFRSPEVALAKLLKMN